MAHICSLAQFSASTIADAVAARRQLAFSRWGDGEWTAVLGRDPDGANCDGHRYFSAMRVALRAVLESRPPYYLGMQPHALRTMGAAIENWLLSRKLQAIPWVNADVIHLAAAGGSWRVRNAIRRVPHVVVGPNHLRSAFPRAKFIEIPGTNCWLQTDFVIRRVSHALSRMPDYAAVAFCAGMASNVWIDRLYEDFGGRAALLDIGSAFDPLAGVYSRAYMKKTSFMSRLPGCA